MFTRFKVGDGAFAFIDNTPFVIQDISKGGVQVKSVVYDDSPPEEMKLDIFFENEKFFLQNIPVNLIRFQKDGSFSPFSSSFVNSFGLQFGELTEQQKTRLDYFISSCSSGEA